MKIFKCRMAWGRFSRMLIDLCKQIQCVLNDDDQFLGRNEWLRVKEFSRKMTVSLLIFLIFSANEWIDDRCILTPFSRKNKTPKRLKLVPSIKYTWRSVIYQRTTSKLALFIYYFSGAKEKLKYPDIATALAHF